MRSFYIFFVQLYGQARFLLPSRQKKLFFDMKILNIWTRYSIRVILFAFFFNMLILNVVCLKIKQ